VKNVKHLISNHKQIKKMSCASHSSSTTTINTFAPSHSFLSFRKCLEYALNAMDTIPPCKTFLSTPAAKKGYQKLFQNSPVVFLNQMKSRLSTKSYVGCDQYGLTKDAEEGNHAIYVKALQLFLHDVALIQRNTKYYYDVQVFSKQNPTECLLVQTGIGKRNGSSDFGTLLPLTASPQVASNNFSSILGTDPQAAGDGIPSPTRQTRRFSSSSSTTFCNSTFSSSAAAAASIAGKQPFQTFSDLPPNSVDYHIPHQVYHGAKEMDCLTFHYDVDIMAMLLHTHVKLWLHFYLFLLQPTVYRELLAFYQLHYQHRLQMATLDLTPPAALPTHLFTMLRTQLLHIPLALQWFYQQQDILNYLFQPTCIIDKHLLLNVHVNHLQKIYHSLRKLKEKMFSLLQQYQVQLQAQLQPSAPSLGVPNYSILPFTTSTATSTTYTAPSKVLSATDMIPEATLKDMFSLVIVEEHRVELYEPYFNIPNKSIVDKLWSHEQVWITPKNPEGTSTTSSIPQEDRTNIQHARLLHVKPSRRFKAADDMSSEEDEPFVHSYITSSSNSEGEGDEEEKGEIDEEKETLSTRKHIKTSIESSATTGNEGSNESILINLVTSSQLSTIASQLPNPQQVQPTQPSQSPMITLKSNKINNININISLESKEPHYHHPHQQHFSLPPAVATVAESKPSLIIAPNQEITVKPQPPHQQIQEQVDEVDDWMNSKQAVDRSSSSTAVDSSTGTNGVSKDVDSWGKLFPSLILNPTMMNNGNSNNNSGNKKRYHESECSEDVVDLCSSGQVSSFEEGLASSTRNPLNQKESEPEPDSLEDVYVPLKSSSKHAQKLSPKRQIHSNATSTSTPSPKKTRRELTPMKTKASPILLLSTQRSQPPQQVSVMAPPVNVLSQSDVLLPTNLPALLEAEQEMKKHHNNNNTTTNILHNHVPQLQQQQTLTPADLHMRFPKILETIAKSMPLMFQYNSSSNANSSNGSSQHTFQELCRIVVKLEACCEELNALHPSQ
jgi:hypothetical protein